MNPYETSEQDPQMRQVMAFLEQAPDVHIPTEFAAETASRIAARKRRVPAPGRTGTPLSMRLLYGAIVCLTLLTFAAAACGSHGDGTWLTVEWLACAQLLALVLLVQLLRRSESR